MHNKIFLLLVQVSFTSFILKTVSAFLLPNFPTTHPSSLCASTFTTPQNLEIPLNEETTNSSSLQGEHQNLVHIISLPCPPSLDSATIDRFSSTAREVWDWKNDVLGNGLDYFVSRQGVTQSFNSDLIRLGEVGRTVQEDTDKRNSCMKVTLTECGTLSNCARFDILVVSAVDYSVIVDEENSKKKLDTHLMDDVPLSVQKKSENLVKKVVAEHLARCLWRDRRQSKTNGFIRGNLNSWMKSLPFSSLNKNDVHGETEQQKEELLSLANEIESELNIISGSINVASYLCRVSSGLLLDQDISVERKKRKEKQMVLNGNMTISTFRPFSSRDSHVMLQMKRCAEASFGPRVKILLDSALEAGKASRNVNTVPQLQPLRQYGSGDGNRCVKPPKQLTINAAQAAMRLAIEPTVKKCQQRLLSLDSSTQISALRDLVEMNVLSKYYGNVDDIWKTEYGLLARKLLHKPIMRIREGQTRLKGDGSDLNDIVEGIRQEIDVIASK